MPDEPTAAPGAAEPAGPRRGCIGCLTAVVGLGGGGMIAVLVAVIVDYVTRAKRCPDVPSCNWLEYAVVGMAIGVIVLPLVTLSLTRRARRAGPDTPDRG